MGCDLGADRPSRPERLPDADSSTAPSAQRLIVEDRSRRASAVPIAITHHDHHACRGSLRKETKKETKKETDGYRLGEKETRKETKKKKDYRKEWLTSDRCEWLT